MSMNRWYLKMWDYPPRFLWSLYSFTRNQSEFLGGRNCEIMCHVPIPCKFWHGNRTWCHLKIPYKNLYPLYTMLFQICSSLDIEGFRPKVDACSFSSCILMWTSNMCHFFTSLKRVTLQPRSRWLFWFHRGDLKCRASGVSTKGFPARLEIPKSSKTQLGMYIFMYIIVYILDRMYQ